MKKRFIILLLLTILLMSGCDFNTKASVSKLDKKINNSEIGMKNFKCKALDDYDIVGINRKLMLLSDGNLYETSISKNKKLDNGENCKKIDSDIRFKKIIEDEYYLSEDGKIYIYLDNKLKEISELYIGYVIEHNEDIVDAVLYKDSKLLEKYMKELREVDPGYTYQEYQVLKTDGNIYNNLYRIYYDEDLNTTKAELVKENLVYSKKDFGDIYYITSNCGSELSLGVCFLASDKGFFELKNGKLKPVKKINKYLDNIKYVNAYYLFTDNNSVIDFDELYYE